MSNALRALKNSWIKLAPKKNTETIQMKKLNPELLNGITKNVLIGSAWTPSLVSLKKSRNGESFDVIQRTFSNIISWAIMKGSGALIF